MDVNEYVIEVIEKMRKRENKSRGDVRVDVNEKLKLLRKCKNKFKVRSGEGGEVGQGGGERTIEVIVEMQI